MMRLPRALCLLFLFVALVACGGDPKEPSQADPSARFEGQGLAILLFDKSNADCWRDLGELTPARLRACAGPALGDEPFAITTDPDAFDPAPERHMAFVAWGPGIQDPDWGEGSDGYLAVIGLGPLPAASESLIGPASLIDNSGSLLDSGTSLSGGQAIVTSGGQTLTKDQAAPIVNGTEPLLQQQANLLCPACPDNPEGRLDTGHSHFPCTGDHIHTFVYNQNPATCDCFLNKGAVICL